LLLAGGCSGSNEIIDAMVNLKEAESYRVEKVLV